MIPAHRTRRIPKISLLKLCALVFIFLSCRSVPGKQTDSRFSIQKDTPRETHTVELEWNKINSFASSASFYVRTGNKKTHCTAVKIDLKNPSVSVVSFPGDAFPEHSIDALSFSKKSGASVVINTVPFAQKIKGLSKKIPVGIIQNGTERFSEPQGKYCALAFFETASGISAEIFESQNGIDFFQNGKKLLCCHGGFWQILKNGTIIEQFKEIHDARTAAGISSDKQTFFILAAEKTAASKGLSFTECALILKKLGASDAMQFDGGHSSCLILNGKSALSPVKNPNLPAFIGFSEKN